MDESSQSENILPERLHRSRKNKGERGCALGLGLLLTTAAVVGGGILLVTEVESAGLYYALSVGGGLFGLLLLWSWFVQKMTAEIPPAIVEISEFPLVSGTDTKICVRQPGPATFKTLRANLICLRRKRDYVSQPVAGETRSRPKAWVDTQIYDQNLIDVYEVQPSAGDEWSEQADFYVPPDQPPSMMEKDLQISWRIEVWGRVGFGIGVMHSFDVSVAAGNEETG